MSKLALHAPLYEVDVDTEKIKSLLALQAKGIPTPISPAFKHVLREDVVEWFNERNQPYKLNVEITEDGRTYMAINIDDELIAMEFKLRWL